MTVDASPSATLDPGVLDLRDAQGTSLRDAIVAEGWPVRRLPSGAGHDGMAIVDIADIGMLFVRCTGGVSHNPQEAITSTRRPCRQGCCCASSRTSGRSASRG